MGSRSGSRRQREGDIPGKGGIWAGVGHLLRHQGGHAVGPPARSRWTVGSWRRTAREHALDLAQTGGCSGQPVEPLRIGLRQEHVVEPVELCAYSGESLGEVGISVERVQSGLAQPLLLCFLLPLFCFFVASSGLSCSAGHLSGVLMGELVLGHWALILPLGRAGVQAGLLTRPIASGLSWAKLGGKAGEKETPLTFRARGV